MWVICVCVYMFCINRKGKKLEDKKNSKKCMAPIGHFNESNKGPHRERSIKSIYFFVDDVGTVNVCIVH